MSAIVLLGPQRLKPTAATIVEELGIEGPIAAITAGWEERESEDDELAEHFGGRTVNLKLHERAETAGQQLRQSKIHRRRAEVLVAELARIVVNALYVGSFGFFPFPPVFVPSSLVMQHAGKIVPGSLRLV